MDGREIDTDILALTISVSVAIPPKCLLNFGDRIDLVGERDVERRFSKTDWTADVVGERLALVLITSLLHHFE